MKTVKVTKNEMKILEAIIMADHSGDGHGLCGYIYHSDFDMKKMRGVMASLTNKGICRFVEDEDEDSPPSTWGFVVEAFQEKTDKDEALSMPDSLEKNCIEWNGYKLINIEVA